MSFILEAVRDRPVGLWSMDDDSPSQDYSGHNRNATATGTRKGLSLVNGAERCTIVSNTAQASFEAPVFNQGQEHRAFSLEATFRATQPSEGITDSRENLLLNPSFKNNATGWTNNGGDGAVSWDADNGGSGKIVFSGTVASGFMPTAYITAAPGETFTILAKGVRQTVGAVTGREIKPAIVWYNGSTVVGSFAPATGTASSTSPTDISLTYTVPADATTVTHVRVPLNFYGTQLNDAWLVDSIMVVRGDMPAYGYFDGDTPGAVWNGTPHNSTSTMLVSDGEQQVLGNQNQYDGLVIDGTKIIFKTRYATGEVVSEYDLEAEQTVHAVGVHTGELNRLYVNGVMVAEQEIPEELLGASFVTTSPSLYSGASVSSRELMLNGVGIYGHALSYDAVARHYEESMRHIGRDSVTALFSGERVPLSIDIADVFAYEVWATEDDWQTGYRENVSINDSQLQPEIVDGVSVAGSWYNAFPLDVAETLIHGVSLAWEGEGATVEVSLDGTTWEVVAQGQNVETIPAGFDPTEQILDVRVSFPGGITDDTSYLDTLTVTGFASDQITVPSGRAVTVERPAYLRRDYEPVELSDDWGVVLNGGAIEIGTMADFTPNTVEVWIKRTGTVTWSTDFSNSTNFYSNGLTGADYPVGEWVVRHFVNAAGYAAALRISGDAQIGQVVLYDEALTGAQIEELVNSYSSLSALRVTDSGAVSVLESLGEPEIYSHDWAISASG